ncbi:hypothetical protein KP509_36G056400 [Ceratopteris richardii]|uniref:Uncharacterized protein n=1 Tax=Ceratopteris richardii TaxID=49495 RepID=A0A8T2QDD6_CERRI|nr:hypothetical protein KP509_36G056400 [Ceratopteris richardii]
MPQYEVRCVLLFLFLVDTIIRAPERVPLRMLGTWDSIKVLP